MSIVRLSQSSGSSAEGSEKYLKNSDKLILKPVMPNVNFLNKRRNINKTLCIPLSLSS